MGTIRLVLFALPWLPMAFIMMPLGMFIPAFYASHTSVTLATVGLGTAVARILDAFIDPMIGHLSDRTRSRLGPRKPWIVVGTVLFSVCVWQLFQPPPSAGVGYYLLWSGGLYFAYACVEIPMRAWGSELSRDTIERARIFTTVGLLMATGSLLFWLAPLLVQAFGGSPRLDDPRGMVLVATIFILIFPVLILGSVSMVPQASQDAAAHQTFRQLVQSIHGNKPFWIYVAGLSIWSVGNAAANSLVFIFLADYLGLAEQVATIMITYFVVQLAAMPLWVRLLPRFDKHRLLASCWLLDAALKPFLLSFEPGAVNVVGVYALLIPSAILGSISYTFPQAVLADVVDFDTLKTRSNKAASYFAINTLLYKVMMGVGTGIALPLLGAFGYVLGQTHDSTARLGMMLGIVAFPALCLFAAGLTMWRFPINARRHAAMVRRLASRQRRGS